MFGVKGIRSAYRFCVQCNGEHWHHVHEHEDKSKEWFTCWCCGNQYCAYKSVGPVVFKIKPTEGEAKSCDDRLCDGHCDRCWY